jgi:hypothetical protein
MWLVIIPPFCYDMALTTLCCIVNGAAKQEKIIVALLRG